MNDSFQYGDLIFLGLVAVFVLFRFRAMLGRGGADQGEVWKNAARKLGEARPSNPLGPLTERVGRKASEPEEDLLPAQLKDNAPVAEGLKAIKAGDPNFSTADFLAGAKIAFEWVIEAFSKGDKEKLRKVLASDQYKHFCDEIDLRATAETHTETTLISILSADITEAVLGGRQARITVQFTSEQINVRKDKENKAVSEGDASVIEKMIDIWTFERDTVSRDPNWKIVAT